MPEDHAKEAEGHAKEAEHHANEAKNLVEEAAHHANEAEQHANRLKTMAKEAVDHANEAAHRAKEAVDHAKEPDDHAKESEDRAEQDKDHAQGDHGPCKRGLTLGNKGVHGCQQARTKVLLVLFQSDWQLRACTAYMLLQQLCIVGVHLHNIRLLLALPAGTTHVSFLID